MSIKPEHIVTLQGRQYVTLVGLLDHAHQNGLRSIETQIVQLPTAENQMTAVFCCIATFAGADGPVTWSCHGDASPRNVNRMIAEALPRMAETRSIARTLRMATNIGQTSLEELPGDDPDTSASNWPRTAPESRGDAGAQLKPDNRPACVWKGCGAIIDSAQAKASHDQFGKHLCGAHMDAAFAKGLGQPTTEAT